MVIYGWRYQFLLLPIFYFHSPQEREKKSNSQWKCIDWHKNLLEMYMAKIFELFLEACRKQDSMVGGLLYAYGVRSYASYKLAAFCKHRKYTFVRFFFVALWDRRMILIFFFIVAVVTYDLIIWFVLDQCQLSDPHCNI